MTLARGYNLLNLRYAQTASKFWLHPSPRHNILYSGGELTRPCSDGGKDSSQKLTEIFHKGAATSCHSSPSLPASSLTRASTLLIDTPIKARYTRAEPSCLEAYQEPPMMHARIISCLPPAVIPDVPAHSKLLIRPQLLTRVYARPSEEGHVPVSLLSGHPTRWSCIAARL
jgi:hypothetical protein